MFAGPRTNHFPPSLPSLRATSHHRTITSPPAVLLKQVQRLYHSRTPCLRHLHLGASTRNVSTAARTRATRRNDASGVADALHPPSTASPSRCCRPPFSPTMAPPLASKRTEISSRTNASTPHDRTVPRASILSTPSPSRCPTPAKTKSRTKSALSTCTALL